MNLRTMTSALMGRMRLANIAGKTFGGKRDLYTALGYPRELFPGDYRSRFNRGGIAGRIVESKPESTWRSGGELVEDDDPKTNTPFEKAWQELDERLTIWTALKNLDILSGIGRFAVLLMGAPGDLDTPLESCRPEDLVYLTAFAEEDATVHEFDIDIRSPRFGQPEFYMVKRTNVTSPNAINSDVIGKKVHWSRMVHAADGRLDDKVYGTPRLERVWNLLDDLEKVTGGGAEAFWKRADQGKQFDLDPTMDLSTDQVAEMKNEVDAYTHDLKRVIRTRGMTINSLGSDVADFKSPSDAIISQISASVGIPQRILMGSERGNLASTQDRENWSERITARRHEYAGPMIVRPFVDRLIKLGVLPQPKLYKIRWPEIQNLNESDRAEVAAKWATLNQTTGEIIVTRDEIRDRVLGLPPLDDVEEKDQKSTWDRVLKADHLSIDEKREATGFVAFSGDAEADPVQTVPYGLLPKSTLRMADQTVPANEPGGKPGKTGKPGAVPPVVASMSDDGLLSVLEAAIEHDKPAIIEHILGIQLGKEPVSRDAERISTEIAALKATVKPVDNAPLLASIVALSESFSASMKALAEREQPAPVVTVNVDVPPMPVPSKKIQTFVRDGKGLITQSITE